MKFTQLFTRTTREISADETAINAQYLIRGGFVYKNSAGVYSFLPLGWRVAQKIMAIVRQEMNKIGGQELFMPALVEKKFLEPTGRWNLDVGFFAKSMNEKEASFTLGWTHEEVLTAIASRYVSSYKDLPFSAYQIQTKFRNEARAKSGLLRGREFMMKDLYSFHASEADLMDFYERAKEAYLKIFSRVGLKAFYTLAAGGDFTANNTHEFQVVTPIGEDTIYICGACEYAENKEISNLKVGDACPKCQGVVREEKSVEVGNIFPLGTKYSVPLGLEFVNQDGVKNPVVMGSYGIGISRLMATIVEVMNDPKGILWPESVAPFKVHLISLEQPERVEKIYQRLVEDGVEVLYDNRDDKTAGEKFADADLIGCPIRLVVSRKIAEDEIEIRRRSESAARVIHLNDLAASL